MIGIQHAEEILGPGAGRPVGFHSTSSFAFDIIIIACLSVKYKTNLRFARQKQQKNIKGTPCSVPFMFCIGNQIFSFTLEALPMRSRR